MYACDQVNWSVHKLARCLRVKSPSEASTPSVVGKIGRIDAGDFQQNGQQPQERMTEETTDKLLIEIREIRKLLQVQVWNKAAECKEPDVDVMISKNDWKLAAAVFDRCLLINFCILLVAGTVVFFSVFTINYHPDN